jgi:hypothetical protein
MERQSAVMSLRLEPPLLGKARVAIVADDDVVTDRDAKNVATSRHWSIAGRSTKNRSIAHSAESALVPQYEAGIGRLRGEKIGHPAHASPPWART